MSTSWGKKQPWYTVLSKCIGSPGKDVGNLTRIEKRPTIFVFVQRGTHSNIKKITAFTESPVAQFVPL